MQQQYLMIETTVQMTETSVGSSSDPTWTVSQVESCYMAADQYVTVLTTGPKQWHQQFQSFEENITKSQRC